MMAPRPCRDTSVRDGATIPGSLPRSHGASSAAIGHGQRLLRGNWEERMRRALQAAIRVEACICFLSFLQILVAGQVNGRPLQDRSRGADVGVASTRQTSTRILSGRMVTDKNESVGGVTILVRCIYRMMAVSTSLDLVDLTDTK